ncbi:tyrosine-type recombinase/integrase [Streptomyces sp. SID13666]|uniref:tyrosine-type recombinase/integrase n=1 Tax=Streptomyces sp. SID13666 TaxID=2706054 RepID=UPI0013C233E2|nr:tyrosine-type recombinase/integrase [Streptomyces sp. SID13666]NEA53553.1 tyrosine-type recombinase/integrase [Streptomyces sp. SID13666]
MNASIAAEEVIDAELVDDARTDVLLPAPTDATPTWLLTRDTLLGAGELPQRADEQVNFTERDFTVSPRVKQRAEQRGARNTRINRDTTRERYAAWCHAVGRVARPTTTTANVAEYVGHLMEKGKGKPGEPHVQYSPDSLLAYTSRIITWYPKGQRPDASLLREMIEDYRLEEYIPAGGEKEQAAGLTMKYLVRVLDCIDEDTRIGRRDAAMLVTGYGMLSRSVEVAGLLVKHVRLDTDGVWVWTAKSKTRRKGGRWRFIRDRADLKVVARVRAWLADLRALAAYAPTLPLFRALNTDGSLKGRGNATVNGLHLSGRAVNEMVKKRAAGAGVSVINGLKVTSHSLRAGPNTDMAEADVPLAERNTAGDWGRDSTLADEEYNRPDGSIDISKRDPLDAVPLYGSFTNVTAPG